jgi:pyruvate kinase
MRGDSMTITLPNHKTKIVCTIGPASHSENILEILMRQGMNVARLNLSHGTLDGHREDIRRIRSVAARLDRSCTILADLPGRKIRIGKLQIEPVELEEGNTITLTTKNVAGTASRIFVNYERFTESVSKGGLIYLNDGFIQLLVETITSEEVVCRILVGGQLLSYKGVSLPGSKMHIDPVTPRDLELIDFGLQGEVDAFAISFVEKADDILRIRQFVKKKGRSTYLIAKIERAEAIENIDEILEAADAIMIARGDLGVHIPLENLPGVQKKMIHKANLLGCPVITATQMLLSMTDHVRPTRAEVSDVANAILDGTDAVMLSEETAIGRYPVESVEMMARIAVSIEDERQSINKLSDLREYFRPRFDYKGTNVDDLISFNVVESAHALPVPCIIVSTKKGDEPRMLSRFKPDCWILAFSADERIRRFMDLSYGVLPITVGQDADHSLKGSLRFIVESELVSEKSLIIATGDFPADDIADEHSLRIIRPYLLETGRETEMDNCEKTPAKREQDE